jgi:hypothetical protein
MVTPSALPPSPVKGPESDRVERPGCVPFLDARVERSTIEGSRRPVALRAAERLPFLATLHTGGGSATAASAA